MAKIDFGGVVENVVTREEFHFQRHAKFLKMKLLQ